MRKNVVDAGGRSTAMLALLVLGYDRVVGSTVRTRGRSVELNARTLESKLPHFSRERGSCGGTSRLEDGKQWLPHVGARQRDRVLRRNWERFERRCARDGSAAVQRERLLDQVSEEPDPEYGAMHLALAAQLAAERAPAGAGDVVDALRAILNKFEQVAAENPPAEGAQP